MIDTWIRSLEVEGLVVTAKFASTAPQARYEVRVDGGTWKAATSPWTSPKLRAGEHRIDVRSINRRGKKDPKPATATVTTVGAPAMTDERTP